MTQLASEKRKIVPKTWAGMPRMRKQIVDYHVSLNKRRDIKYKIKVYKDDQVTHNLITKIYIKATNLILDLKDESFDKVYIYIKYADDPHDSVPFYNDGTYKDFRGLLEAFNAFTEISLIESFTKETK